MLKEFKEYIVTVEDIDIYVKVYGTGKPIVLLHGNGQKGANLNNFVDLFDDTYQVISIDSRSHGQSESTDKMSIKLMAIDVAEVLKYFKIKKASVLGYSDGGNIALRLAIDHPHIVDKMIIISANATPKGIVKEFRVAFNLVKDGMYFLSHKVKLISTSHYAKAKLLTDYPKIKRKELQSIQHDVLLIYAEHDLITKRHITYIYRSIQHSKLLVILRTTHFSIVNRYDKYKTDVLEFLKQRHPIE